MKPPYNAEPIIEPPCAAGCGASKTMLLRSQGRAEASLPTFSARYCFKSCTGAGPAPWKANGEAACAAGLRLRMNMAEQGLPNSGSMVGYEIFDKSDTLGATSFVQNINHLRALEGERWDNHLALLGDGVLTDKM